MSENMPSKPLKTTRPTQRLIQNVTQLLVAFLAGYVPMWLKSRESSSSLAEAARQLSLARMQNALGAAAIDARRGDFETARLAASDFFTLLRAETSKGACSALSRAQIAGLQPLRAQHDEIITLLARGDAAAADVLSDGYVSFRTLVNA